jgi:hypothetical protein
MGFEVLGDNDSPVMPIMLYNPAKIPAFSRECLNQHVHYACSLSLSLSLSLFSKTWRSLSLSIQNYGIASNGLKMHIGCSCDCCIPCHTVASC